MLRRYPINVPPDQEIESVPSEGYAPFFFPPEGAKLVFQFTDETFLKVLSALINGAAYTYPNEWMQVVWYFLQNVEYPVSLCDEIAAAILTCEDVQLALAGVIGTPGPVQDAISDLVVQSPEINTYISQIVKGLNPGQITGPLIAGSCDNSVLAGKMLTLIDRLDENNKDALELIEVGTNDEEKTATILEGIPIADELPIGDIIDFAQDILEDFSENYNGASTIDRREQTAQDLYCLAKSKPDCELTYGDLFDYFQVKAASGLTLGSLIGDIVNFLADGDFDTDDAVFYGMMALQIAAIRTGQEFFGINAPRITALTRDASPSSIWEEWGDCPPSGEWCRELNSAHDLEALFVPSGGSGNAAAWTGTGWGPNPSLGSRISIHGNFIDPFNVTSMQIYMSTTIGGDWHNVTLYSSGYTTVYGAADLDVITDPVIDLGTGIAIYQFEIDVVSSLSYPGGPGYVAIGGEITAIKVRGIGDEPTWGEDCLG